MEVEEIVGGSKSKYFIVFDKCEKNGGVGMFLRCFVVMENVIFFSE